MVTDFSRCTAARSGGKSHFPTGNWRATDPGPYVLTESRLNSEPNPRRTTRSTAMVQVLKQHLLYSEKRARDLLFHCIEQRLSAAQRDGRTLIVSRLIREAGHCARPLADRAGYDFANWQTAGKAVLNAMIGAQTLLGEGGRPVAPGITAHAAEVHELVPDYRDRTEAYLLEFLIRMLPGIGVRDHTALAHALFRQFDPSVSLGDLEDRVVLLLATLADRISISPGGIYRPAAADHS